MQPTRWKERMKIIPPSRNRYRKETMAWEPFSTLRRRYTLRQPHPRVGRNFYGLAAAASAKPPTPLFMQPGTIVKTEFKSNIRPDTDADLEADFASVAQAGAKNRNQAQPKPTVAYRERRSGTMAPAPKAKQSDRSAQGRMVAADEDDSELEADLEKDLV